MSRPKEREVWKQRMSIRALWLFLTATIALLGLGLFLRTPLIALIAAFLTVLLFLAIQSTEYVITNYRIRAKYGLIGRRINEAYLDKIMGVEIEQSIIDRILNVGTVIATLHGHDAGYVKLVGVSSPERVKEILDDMVFRNKAYWR